MRSPEGRKPFFRKEEAPEEKTELVIENDRYRISKEEDKVRELFHFESEGLKVDVLRYNDSPEDTAHAGIHFLPNGLLRKEISSNPNAKISHQEMFDALAHGARGLRNFLEAIENEDIPQPNFIMGLTNPKMARLCHGIGFRVFEDFVDKEFRFTNELKEEKISNNKEEVYVAITFEDLKDHFRKNRERYDRIINRYQERYER